MGSIPAKVVAMQERACQYQVVVKITNKYRGSFNTLAFGEIKPYSGSLNNGRLDLVYYLDPGSEGRGSIPALDAALTAFYFVLIPVVLEFE
jgi:hypothetical protein